MTTPRASPCITARSVTYVEVVRASASAVQCVRINQGRSPLHPPKIAGELSHLSRDNVREHGAPAWVEMRSCHAFGFLLIKARASRR
jgi:hypothetical protein